MYPQFRMSRNKAVETVGDQPERQGMRVRMRTQPVIPLSRPESVPDSQ
jgi:hypothetical protein